MLRSSLSPPSSFFPSFSHLPLSSLRLSPLKGPLFQKDRHIAPLKGKQEEKEAHVS